MQVVNGRIKGRYSSSVPLNCAVVCMTNKAAEVSKLNLVPVFNTQLSFICNCYGESELLSVGLSCLLLLWRKI